MSSLPDDLQRALLAFAYASEAGVKRWRITRLAMYSALTDRLVAADGSGKRCLCISGSGRLARVLGLRKTTLEKGDYPDVDLLRLPFADESLDFLVADQVLEHVAGDPFQAMAETVRVLRPGGQAVHTTCFVNAVHDAPGDYWRFTPEALELLTTTAGGEVVLSGGWGNRAALEIIAHGFRWRPIPESADNPVYQVAVRNEPDFPIVTWVVLRKPDRT